MERENQREGRERDKFGQKGNERERERERDRKKFSPEVNKDFINSCSSVEGCISLPV
jgi:hypothetical protein